MSNAEHRRYINMCNFSFQPSSRVLLSNIGVTRAHDAADMLHSFRYCIVSGLHWKHQSVFEAGETL